MADLAVMPVSDYVAMCDAVRSLTGTTGKIRSGEMADIIKNFLEWDGVMYSNGDECSYITGGWVATAVAGSNQLTAKAPDVTRHDDRITVKLSGTAVGGGINPKNAIDFGPYKTLTYTVTDHNTGSTNQVHISIADESDNVVSQNRCYQSGTYTIDISGLNGKYRPCVHLATVSETSTVSLVAMKLS